MPIMLRDDYEAMIEAQRANQWRIYGIYDGDAEFLTGADSLEEALQNLEEYLENEPDTEFFIGEPEPVLLLTEKTEEAKKAEKSTDEQHHKRLYKQNSGDNRSTRIAYRNDVQTVGQSFRYV